MFSYLLLVSMLSIMASGITVDDCPPGLKRDRFLKVYGGKCYRFEVEKSKEFDNAQNYCQQNGGNLAAVKSKAVNNFIHNTLTGTYGLRTSLVWIGLRFGAKTKDFHWVDGTLLRYRNFKDHSFYLINECVAMVSGTGLWGNYKCEDSTFFGTDDQSHHFICEYPPIMHKDCPSNLKRDKYLMTYGNNCYRFELSLSKDYQDAQDYCEQDGGNLAIVKSKGTNDFIKNKLNAFGYYISHIWIGLRYYSLQGSFSWVDGTPLKRGFTNFRSKQFFTSDECVAMIAESGLWENYKCQSTLFWVKERNHFVCEYPKLQPPTTQKTVRTEMTINDCPSNLERDGRIKVLGNRCYRFEAEKTVTFQQARGYCQQNGGNLAILKSQYINDFIKHELNKIKTNIHFWIGLRYSSLDGKFHWLDGTQGAKFSNFRHRSYYTSNECVAISPKDGIWDAYTCRPQHSWGYIHAHFICEYHILPPITTTMLPQTTAQQTTPNQTTKLTAPMSTSLPTTPMPTTKPTTPMPTTLPTTRMPTTLPMTPMPTTPPTTPMPTTPPTTPMPTTLPTTPMQTTPLTTPMPTTEPPTPMPTTPLTTPMPTTPPTTPMPTTPPTTPMPTTEPATPMPTTEPPTPMPTTPLITPMPTTPLTTPMPTTEPPTPMPTTKPTTPMPTTKPTTPMPTTTRKPATTGCPSIVCNLDCGLDGYIVHPETGCMVCECDS